MRRILVFGMLVLMSLLTPACVTNKSAKSVAVFREELPSNNEDVVVYVYRMRSMLGAAVGWKVRLDGKEVAVLRNGTYLTTHTTPGSHEVVVGDDPTGGAIIAGTKALNTYVMTGGNSYYYRVAGFKGYFVDKEVAMKEFPRLRCVNPPKP